MRLHRSIRAIILGLVALSAPTLRAEEGGSGHYLPGSMSSFIDGVPPGECFLARLNLLGYEGSFQSGQPLPIAGLRALGVDASSFASGLTLLWRPPFELGGNWSYAMSATVPYVWLDVSADVDVTLPRGLPATVRRSDSIDGIGDIVLMPLMLNYKFSDDLSANFRLGIYAPTGDYETGRLANGGKNYWTFEPTVGLMYLGQKNGIEASLFAGMDFNTENGATDYQTGKQFHVEGTLAQHLPLAGGLIGIGVNGFWYEQVTGDSGPGANLGDFEGRTAGVGPVLSYTRKIGKVDMLAEVKWLPEIETRRRLEGDYIWFKLAFKF